MYDRLHYYKQFASSSYPLRIKLHYLICCKSDQSLKMCIVALCILQCIIRCVYVCMVEPNDIIEMWIRTLRPKSVTFWP